MSLTRTKERQPRVRRIENMEWIDRTTPLTDYERLLLSLTSNGTE